MRHRHFGIAALVALGLTGGGIINRPVSGQQPPACLHGQAETQAQGQRRQQALTLTRQINTLEARAHAQTGAYQAVQQLQQLSLTALVPEGFAMRLSTDGNDYAFIVRDTLDACRFSYFSDQDGVIYVGQALR